jgi:hypothetical protein
MAVLIDTDVFSYVLRRDPRANLYEGLPGLHVISEAP